MSRMSHTAKALVQIAGDVDHQFELLEAVIKVNNKQQLKLVEKARSRFGSLRGKKVALLGLAFKPNTDDMREAASIVIVRELLKDGALVTAYDPVAVENAKRIIGDEVVYASSVEEALTDADLAMIVTEWEEIKQLPLDLYAKYMKTPIVFDGRNCYPHDSVHPLFLAFGHCI